MLNRKYDANKAKNTNDGLPFCTVSIIMQINISLQNDEVL